MLRKFFASLFAFLFIVTFTPFVFAMGLYSTFTDKDFYLGGFVDLAHKVVVIEAPKKIDYKEFNFLKPEDVSGFLEKIADKDAVKQMISSIFDQVSTSKVKDNRIKFKLDLDWIAEKKQFIRSEITDIFYQRLPKCSEKIDEVPEDYNCVPTQLAKIDFDAYIGRMVDTKFFANIPNEYVFYLTVPDNFNGTLADFVGGIAKSSFIGFVLFLSVLLVLIGLLVFRPIWLVVKWESKVLFFASLLSTLFFGFLYFVPSMFSFLYDKVMINLPKESFELVQEFLKLFIESVSLKLVYFTLPLLIFSLILWLIARSK